MSIKTVEELTKKLIESGARAIETENKEKEELKDSGILYFCKPKLDIK